MGRSLIWIFALIIVVGFLARDANFYGSIVVLVALAGAAAIHVWRNDGSSTPSRKIFWQRVRQTLRSGTLYLLLVEFLLIAVAAHFITNDPDVPYQQLWKLISCWFTCFKTLFLSSEVAVVNPDIVAL